MNRRRAASLSGRITLLLLVTTLLLLGGGSLVMDHQVDHALEHRIRQDLLSQADEVIETLQAAPGAHPSSEAVPVSLLGRGAYFYTVHCDGHEWLHSAAPPPVLPERWPGDATATPRLGEEILSGRRHLGWVMQAFDLPASPQAAPAVGRTCRLLLMQDHSRLDMIMWNIDWILALGPALALLIALVAVPLIVRRVLQPLDALGERMGDIGPNAPGRRLAATGVRELDPLVARFNEVLARMDEGLARERQFAGGLAHETRTRLAELRALCEVESRYPSGRPLPALLGELGAIGAELENTVNALLLLTRLQSGLEPPQPAEVDPADLLERLRRRHGATARRRGVALQLEQAGTAAGWRTDPALLEVVLGNLVGNACSYAPAGDTVRMRADGHAIVIENAAPDLDADDLAHFGQRFWRKQPPHSGHAGLGLALATAAAQALRLELGHRLRDGRLQARLSRIPAGAGPLANTNDRRSDA